MAMQEHKMQSMAVNVEDKDMHGISSVFNRFHLVLMNLVVRLRDVIIATFCLILLSPFLILIVTLIKRDSPGPIFYKAIRVGKKGHLFKMWKFRTMWDDCDSISQIRLTCSNDSRVTPLGRWLRHTKINELPQLINVLKGEMSLVGPRPEDPEYSQIWTEEEREELLSILPGITSPASLLFRKEEEMLEGTQLLETYFGSIQPDKVRLDLLYVRHRSIWLDLNVLFWTAILLFPKIYSSEPIEKQLFVGSEYRFEH